jgi:hypothetical protein
MSRRTTYGRRDCIGTPQVVSDGLKSLPTLIQFSSFC